MLNLKFRGGVLSRKYADRQGKLDGRMDVPNESWGKGAVPFLVDLNHEAKKKIEQIEYDKFREEERSEAKEVKLRAKVKAAELQLELVNTTLSASRQDLEDALRLERIGDDELGDAKSVKFRTLSTPLYLLLLFFMGIGEFAVTRAAFGYLFNDDPSTATSMTIATVAVSIGFAHLSGIAWKRSHDKANFPNDGVIRFWRLIGVLILVFVFALASARAADIKIPGTENGEVTLTNVAMKGPGYVFAFFILQFVLIMVAMGASYAHYSLPLERMHMYASRTKKSHRKQVKNLKKLRNLEFKLKREIEGRPQIQLRARNRVRAAIHEYFSIAQAYKAGNLRGRSKTVNPNISPFNPPELGLPDWYNS